MRQPRSRRGNPGQWGRVRPLASTACRAVVSIGYDLSNHGDWEVGPAAAMSLPRQSGPVGRTRPPASACCRTVVSRGCDLSDNGDWSEKGAETWKEDGNDEYPGEDDDYYWCGSFGGYPAGELTMRLNERCLTTRRPALVGNFAWQFLNNQWWWCGGAASF